MFLVLVGMGVGLARIVFGELCLWIDSSRAAAAMNMAVDEALLRTSDEVVLRIYGWERPAISVGYFQRWEEWRDVVRGRDAVRRWTGGGLVEHGEDWTYSIIIPCPVAEAEVTARELYWRIHAVLADLLRRSREEVTLADAAGDVSVGGCCFANPVENDVLIGGRKAAGAAQRRTRMGVLHQGSVDGVTLGDSFASDFAAALSDCVTAFVPTPALMQSAAAIAAERYGTEEWLKKF
jgi:lipoate-protein ligase A